MWVFGYGSLMWESWHSSYGCIGTQRASLAGYRRDFNKASTERWGSPGQRGPTLGLSAKADAKCEGLAFEFPDANENSVLDYLRGREGPSFALKEMDVELQDGRDIKAFVPVNDTARNTYIGDLDINERARMAKRALGAAGSCESYVSNAHAELSRMGIADSDVEQFFRIMSSIP